MSHITRNHTREIFEDMREKFKPICENIFLGHRPSSTQSQLKEFVVIQSNYTTRDRGAFQIGYYSVDIYVKNITEGRENTKRLDEIVNGLLEMFPVSGLDGRYTASTPYFTPIGDDNIGYTIWALRGSITINTTDSYNFKIS